MPFEALRFVHAAGVQLDHQFHDVGPVCNDHKTVLLDATLTAFEKLVEASIDQDVSFLLLTGDTFHEVERSLRARVTLLNGLDCLRDAEIAVFVVPGPNDPASAWQSIPRLPDNVTIFNPEVDEPTAIMRDGHVIATIQACRPATATDGMTPSQASGATGGSVQPTQPLRIGILPASVTPGQHPLEQTLGSLLHCTAVDYVAVPSTFDRRTVTQSNRVAHSPGAICPIRPDQTGIRGGTLVSVNADARIQCEALAVSPVRRERFEISVSTDSSWDELIAEMRSQFDETEGAAADLLILDWHITGSGSLLDDLLEPDSESELFELLDLESTSNGSTQFIQRLAVTEESPAESESQSDETWLESRSEDDEESNPLLHGFHTRLDSTHSVVADVIQRTAAVDSQSDSPWARRMSLLADRVDHERVAAQAGRLGATWFGVDDSREVADVGDEIEQSVINDFGTVPQRGNPSTMSENNELDTNRGEANE